MGATEVGIRDRIWIAVAGLALVLSLPWLAGCDKAENRPNIEDSVTRLGDLTSAGKNANKTDKERKKLAEEQEKNRDLTPDQLRAKTVESITKNREKAEKAATEQAKKNSKKDSQKAATNAQNSNFVELKNPKDGKMKKEDTVVNLGKTGGKTGAIVEVQGPKQEKSSGSGRTVNVGGGNKDKNKTVSDAGVGPSLIDPDGEKEVFSVKQPEDRRGFWKKMWDKKPAERDIVKMGKAGEELGAFDEEQLKELKKKGKNPDTLTRTPAEQTMTFGDRVNAQLAKTRLEQITKEREKEEKDKKKGGGRAPLSNPLAGVASTPTPAPGGQIDEGAKPGDRSRFTEVPALQAIQGATAAAATVDPLHEIAAKNKPAPAPAPAGEVVDLSGAPKPPAQPAEDLTAIDNRVLSEDAYRKGLASRDVVAREAAFQRAGIERREDAIPFLLDELTKVNLLGAMAAQTLGTIGKLTPQVEAVLIEQLSSKDGSVRQSCANSLGRMRSRKAVVALAEILATGRERDFTARSTYCEALGWIGDRGAVLVLKELVESRTEVEFVKVRAAVSLARLGDPSGRAHLIRTMDSSQPAMQVLGLTGLAQLNEPDVAGYLSAALESPIPEVWTTAVMLFHRVGPQIGLPMLRQRLIAPQETVKRRAALAMGFLGADEAVPYIERALKFGDFQERVIACELLGNLGRTDKVPQLIAALQDPTPSVRQGAATSLTRLEAKEAIPALIEAARGPQNMNDLPPMLRSSGPDVQERLVMLSCVRILRGEKDDLVISSLPNRYDQSWPEVERALKQQQQELVKLYTMIDLIYAGEDPVGVVLRGPSGKEVTYRVGETVAAGFRIRDLGAATDVKGKTSTPPYVTLTRGDERVILMSGRDPQVDSLRKP